MGAGGDGCRTAASPAEDLRARTALLAARFVVTAADGLYVVEAGATGVAVERQNTTSGVPDALVTFDGAPAEQIGGPTRSPTCSAAARRPRP